MGLLLFVPANETAAMMSGLLLVRYRRILWTRKYAKCSAGWVGRSDSFGSGAYKWAGLCDVSFRGGYSAKGLVRSLGCVMVTNCTIRVVGQVQAQKTSCISVECDLVVLSHASNDCVYVFCGVAENEGVVDIDRDVCGFCCGCPVEETVVKCGHVVSFGKEGGFVVLIK